MTGRLVLALAATALAVSACTGTDSDSTEKRHEGVAGCFRWWWTESETSTTTIHWHNQCPERAQLMVSWQNDRTNRPTDDVMYATPGGKEGSDTWAGIPLSFEQL